MCYSCCAEADVLGKRSERYAVKTTATTTSHRGANRAHLCRYCFGGASGCLPGNFNRASTTLGVVGHIHLLKIGYRAVRSWFAYSEIHQRLPNIGSGNNLDLVVSVRQLNMAI